MFSIRIAYSPNLKKVDQNRSRWAGHLIRMHDTATAKKVMLNKPVGARCQGRPRSRWIEWMDQDGP